MQFSEFQSKLKNSKKSLPLPPGHDQDAGAALCIQVHSTGAMPMFKVNGKVVKPETYDKRFDDFFKQRILNRHPNENEEHYNWRLSAYAPVTKELFDKFLNLCKGSILQPNNFILSAEDEKTSQYIDSMKLNGFLSSMIDFILTNPVGYMAVIEADAREKAENEATKPEIIFIPVDSILMRDSDSTAFTYRGDIIYLNSTEQITIRDGQEFTYTHNIGEVPCWEMRNSFCTPFAHWANTLIRNLNEDEAMSKHYSYPVRQEVSPACSDCNGTGHAKPDPDATEYTSNVSCNTCKGKGTVSRNPGDIVQVSEEMLFKNGPSNMPDLVRYITPDVAIPAYHLGRWQVFYDRCEQALHLRPVSDKVQSGEGKKEDRKDQHLFLLAISNFIFANFKTGLEYVSAYLNLRGNVHEKQSITVVPPKQMDLMGDSELINDFAAVQAKTDDSMLLGELNYTVNNKIYRDDPVQLRISDILYEVDPLYGVSGNALRTKLLSGVFSERDKSIHEKGYLVLKQIARELTAEQFLEADTKTLITELEARIGAMTPQTVQNQF